MRIPSSLFLFGDKINIVMDDDLINRNGNYGEADFKSSTIFLQTPKEHIAGETKIEETFYHELVHMIFDKLAYDDMNDDEKMVTAIGGLFHQAVTTAVYDRKD